MSTYLDLVQERHIDVLLQKEPTSKFLRSYLKQLLNVNSLPMWTTWEDWKGWLAEQEYTSFSSRLTTEVSQTDETEWLDLAESVSIYCEKTYEIRVTGYITTHVGSSFDFQDVVYANRDEVMRHLREITECEDLGELESIDLYELSYEICDTIVGHIEYDLDALEQEYSIGDLTEDERQTVNSRFEPLEVTRIVRRFVNEVYQERRNQLLEREAE